ncbi:MAG TPA: mechanosensitive ion channel domain-containing protein [Nitrospirales bacterium]|jgi:small-conductance mechanosensitive channel
MALLLSEELVDLLRSVVVFGIVTGVALTVRFFALRGLNAWAHRSATRMDDLILENIRVPSIALCLLLGLYAGIYGGHLLSPRFNTIALHVTYALLVLIVTAAVANFAEATVWLTLKDKNLDFPAQGLSLSVLRVTIWIVGALVLLGSLGVSITPMVTALGIGGLAISLALQDTLSNFFAGLHLLIEKPIRPGDFVKLEWGQEGYVATIGWRTTRLRMMSNDLIIVPNNKLTQSVVINYSRLHPERPAQPPAS